MQTRLIRLIWLTFFLSRHLRCENWLHAWLIWLIFRKALGRETAGARLIRRKWLIFPAVFPCWRERRRAANPANAANLSVSPVISGGIDCQNRFFARFWRVGFLDFRWRSDELPSPNPKSCQLMSTSLGSYLGRRDAEHVRRFTSAAVAARAASPRKCEAVSNSTRCRCQRLAMLNSNKCVTHATLPEMLRLDAINRPALERLANGTSACKARRARERLAAMDKRAQFFRWRLDPNSPGETVRFANAHDRQRCIDWLARNGLAIDEVSDISGAMPTALCVDRSLWAALRFVVKANIPEGKALHSARWAHEMDRRYYVRLRKRQAEAINVD